MLRAAAPVATAQQPNKSIDVNVPVKSHLSPDHDARDTIKARKKAAADYNDEYEKRRLDDEFKRRC